MSHTLLCMARTRVHAETVVVHLRAGGASLRHISVLLPDPDETAQETDAGPGGMQEAGAGRIGGVLGLLAGVGVLPIPGVGPVIAAGPIIAALGGAAMGAAVGGIAGALMWIGASESSARRLQAQVRHGGVLVSVECASVLDLERCWQAMSAARASSIVQIGAPPLPDFADFTRPLQGEFA